MMAPVVKADAALARCSASGASSAGSPIRPSGTNGTSAPSGGAQPLLMSVRNGPGRMALTRTLGAKASASPTVSALRPAFAHAYGSSPTLAVREAVVPILMIVPPSRAAMCVAASAASRNGPFRLTASVLSNSSSLTASRLGYSGDMPALFTSTSSLPAHARVSAMSRSQSPPPAHVTGDGHRLTPGRGPDLLGRCLACVKLAGGYHHVGARLGQGLDDGPADAARSPGDDGHLAGQVV